jgi:hypothetical protein
MTPYYFYANVHANGDPDMSKVEALIKTPVIPVVNGKIKNTDESINNTIVHFDSVSFVGGGTRAFAPLVDDVITTGTLQLNIQGLEIPISVRTSGYANFAGDIAPSGTGSITAILSQYFEELQITLRTRKDLEFNNDDDNNNN